MLALLGLWLVLLLPSAKLMGHTCYGFVGFLAHSPLYAFQGLTLVLALAGAVIGARAVSRASSAAR